MESSQAYVESGRKVAHTIVCGLTLPEACLVYCMHIPFIDHLSTAILMGSYVAYLVPVNV